MPTDFRYSPLEPEPISGKEMLRQTEQAINDLGGQIDSEIAEIREIAEEALDTANTALATANGASETAQDALAAAQNAQTSADNALSVANAAQSTADAAQSTANDALNLAATADTKAADAQTTADTALSTANTAQDRADSAYSLAEGAQTSADQAIADSLNALGQYIVTNATSTDPSEYVDADTFSTGPAKIYLTGTSITNFPIPAPFYFDVYTTDEGMSAYQKVFINEEQWVRQATYDNADPDNPVVTWSEWVTLGGGSSIDKAAILAPITVNNSSADFTNVLGDNADYYINVTDAVGMPVPKKGIAEVRTDTTNSHTSIRYTTLDGEIFTRYSESTPDLTIGSGEYLVTLTSGSASTYDYMVVRAQAGNVLSARTTLNSAFTANDSSTGAAGLAVTLNFWAESGFDFDTNGFTLTIADNQGTPTDNITFTYNADGTSVITSGTATIDGKATLRFLSGERTISGGASATFNLYMSWDNSNSVEWTDWVFTNEFYSYLELTLNDTDAVDVLFPSNASMLSIDVATDGIAAVVANGSTTITNSPVDISSLSGTVVSFTSSIAGTVNLKLTLEG